MTKKGYRNTAYDDAFRTIEQECNDALIYFVNNMFGESYSRAAEVERLRNEHFVQETDSNVKRHITDSHFRITERNVTKDYHLECESGGYSESILHRIFQYGVSHASVDTAGAHDRLTIRMPEAGLLVLRDKGNPPEKMVFEIIAPTGSISYDAPVLLMSNFDLDSIFEKKLYFLLPFYFFNLEKMLPEFDRDEVARQDFTEIYCDIIERVRDVLN